jgi:hypothetical protein
MPETILPRLLALLSLWSSDLIRGLDLMRGSSWMKICSEKNE